MDLAKSLFSSRDHVGYVGREDHERKISAALADDDPEDVIDVIRGLNIAEELLPAPGGPFSALTPSMVPQDIMAKLAQPESEGHCGGLPDYSFDEFGFCVDEEDGPEQSSNKLLANVFVEDDQHRLEWEFYSKEINFTEGDGKLDKTEKLQKMVKDGVPHSLRPQVWMHLCGANKKRTSTEITYHEIVRASSDDGLVTSKQIEKDLVQILPNNVCFSHPTSTGVPRLRRILRALAWLYPDIGYCQGTGMIAASLLLLMEEEDAFWTMCTTVEDLLPASYYSSTLIGIQADQKVLRSLISTYLPGIDQVLNAHDIELSLITMHWFLTLYANVVHMKILLRIWDLFFLDGSIVLFKATLAMLKIKEKRFTEISNSAQIFNALSDIPGEIDDVDVLIKTIDEVCGDTLSPTLIETHRRRHLAYLMADQGALVGNPSAVPNLPKQQLQRRQIKRSKSVIQTILFGEDSGSDDAISKNVKQTEILVDLREAILQVARHFLALEAQLASEVQLTADYTMQSHAADRDRYVNVSRSKRRRAKALLDFERRDGDELGFRKNDVIEVISSRDEHCWIGELNGLRGWFPARFVKLLDEKGVKYSRAGDDSVTEKIAHLVRGVLAPAFKRVLLHGIKRPSFLDGPCHPWLFIEEASSREVEKDFNSVYSRLVLCKTYRLDEDGKVLTPEELLYRCVQAINLSHDNAHAQMDVKLRTLICMGLNEEALHLWLEVLCSCVDVVQKWYHPWSFINSPGWVQIKCELRILSQFGFNLNPDWELPLKKETQNQPLKEGVRDMLVKHHLFSWDL